MNTPLFLSGVGFKRAAQGLGLALFFAAIYALSFELQTWITPWFSYAQGISWLFIPAGVKLLAFTVGGWWGLLGVAVMGVVTGDEVWTGGLWMHLGNVTVWAFLPFVIYRWVAWQLSVDSQLANLTYFKVAIIALTVSLASGLLSTPYHAWVGNRLLDNWFADAMAMAMGDFVGIALVMSACVFGLRLSHKSYDINRGDL